MVQSRTRGGHRPRRGNATICGGGAEVVGARKPKWVRVAAHQSKLRAGESLRGFRKEVGIVNKC